MAFWTWPLITFWKPPSMPAASLLFSLNLNAFINDSKVNFNCQSYILSFYPCKTINEHAPRQIKLVQWNITWYCVGSHRVRSDGYYNPDVSKYTTDFKIDLLYLREYSLGKGLMETTKRPQLGGLWIVCLHVSPSFPIAFLLPLQWFRPLSKLYSFRL